MKKNSTLIACVLLTVLLAAGSFRAQERTREPGQYPPASGQAPSRALRPGLQVTSSEAGTVSGSFTTGGYTIYFEAVRGEANESGDQSAPLYGMDIRVMDWNHLPFLVQTAGSTPVTATWAADEAKNEALAIDREERHRAFAMLPATAKALKAYSKKRLEAMSDLDRSDLEQVITLLESVTLGDLQDFDNTTQAAMTPQAVTYSHKATIKKKALSGNGIESEHSALLLQIYTSGGALLKQYSYSNHGARATDTSMSTKCSKTFIKGNTKVYTADNHCDLWSPYFTQTWDKHGHTCNNDTLQQYLSVKGSASIDWGICNFYLPALIKYYSKAPSCQ